MKILITLIIFLGILFGLIGASFWLMLIVLLPLCVIASYLAVRKHTHRHICASCFRVFNSEQAEAVHVCKMPARPYILDEYE